MSLRNILAKLAGWNECSLKEYTEAYKRYGGSNCTHPRLLHFLQSNTPEKYTFFSKKTNTKITAAIFINSSGEFCLPGKYNKIVNSDEIIFPADSSTKILLPFSSKKISSLHRSGVINKLPSVFNKRQVCLVRNDLCSKTKKNRRNELNRFKKNGGEIVPVTQYNPVQICNIYDTLFKKRWGVNIDKDALHSLERFITDNPNMIFGNVLQMDSQPCAYDLIIKSESPRWLYFDIPNGGVDPSYTHLSVGSVLMWVNTQQAISLSISKGKENRFSLGKPTMDYKKRWCNPHYLLRTI